MKVLFKVVALLAVIVIGAVVYMSSNIDGFVKGIIEDIGSETLATAVTVGSVKVELGSEAGAVIKDLRIANPDGYSQKYAFELGTVGATLKAASLSTDVLVIPKVVVEAASLTFEQKGSASNLQTLLNNMDESASTAEDSAGASDEDVLLAIGELRLTGVGATAITDQLDEPLNFVMSDIVIRDIGTPGSGVTSDQAADIVVTRVLETAMADAKGQVKKAVEAKVRAELDKKTEEAKDNLKQSLRDKLRGN